MMASFFQMNTASTSGSGPLPNNTIANPKGELKAITTRNGIVLNGPPVPMPPLFINPEEDERVEETLTDQDLTEYTIKVPPPLLHINITLADALILIPKYQKMLKALLSNKEKLLEMENTPLNENCSAVILKKLPKKLGDTGKFLILCGLPELISTSITLKLANRAICTPARIARDVFVPIGKFTFPPDFVIVDYESDPKVPLILGRPFLRTARALINVHGEEMILHDDLTSPEVKDDIFDLQGDMMFIDEHALDYSSPPLYDEYDDDLFEVKTNTEYVYYDPFDSKGEKIKESKLLIDELDLSRSSDFLPSSEYDSFLFEDFFEVDTLPSTNNEAKVFNPGILIQQNLSEVITRVAPDKNVKKIAILRNSDERLTLNMRHDTSSYSNQPQKESINMINIFNDSSEDFLDELFQRNHQSGNPSFSSPPKLTSSEVKDDVFDPEGGNVLIEKMINLDSTKDLPPCHNVNPLSGSTTSSSPNHLLEEDNHAPIKEMDSILEDSINEDNLANLNDNLANTMPEMFTDEHALDYSSPPLYDKYNDDFFEFESDTKYVYDDPFDSKGEKIKESKLLIGELNLPKSRDFLPSPECDSFLSKDFSEVDDLRSTNNKEKVFNLGILIQESPFEVITRVALDKNVKKLSISHASLILDDFDPHLYELPFLKEVPGSETLFLFSFENEKKVFKPRILTSKGVHSFFLSEISHRGHKVFKIIKILEIPMEIFPCFYREDIRILDVPCLHFYPL
nr:reverse transcriptase domain-containing protein [Tanacetum cinerariifolium]